MAELVFYTGTMSSGKSTCALQTDYNRRAQGQEGILFTSQSREGSGIISSRLGVSAPAVELHPKAVIAMRLSAYSPLAVDYIICDEAQFYSEEQIDELSLIADNWDVPVFCFGILHDFQAHLFPGSKRLLELADRIEFLPLRPVCWCGKPGTHNARVVAGKVVTSGEQVVVGDIDSAVGYMVLCRKHWREGKLHD